MRFHALSVAALLLAAAPAVLAAGPPPETGRYLENGHYQVRIDDKLVAGARLFMAEAGIPQLVVQVPGQDRAVLVVAGERRALPIEAARVVPIEGETGSVTVLAGGPEAAASALAIEGTALRFSIGPRRYVIEPREALVGEVAPERLLDYMPEYRRGAEAYEPAGGAMRLLARSDVPLEVEVYFGTWCPHCERFVPRLIRVAKDLGNPSIRVRLLGMPPRFVDEPQAKKNGVTGVPTAIVRRAGSEVFRIQGNVWERPEMALLAVVSEDGPAVPKPAAAGKLP